MSDEDVPVVSGQAVPASPALTDALRSALDYAAVSKSAATRKAYRADWIDFTTWCEGVNAAALPAAAETLASHLAQLADRGKRVSTIRRRVAAIAYAHRLKELASPHQAEAVRAVLASIRRTIGTAVVRKAPATAKAVAKMTRRSRGDEEDAAAHDLRSLRDRALLLLGFAAALRRSEFVALDVGDLEFVECGLIVKVRRSKTDQEGEGHEIAVPTGAKLKPVAALREWLEVSQICDGPVFRPIGKGGAGAQHVGEARLTDRSVADIVKRHARSCGFDAAVFSGHSLRAASSPPRSSARPTSSRS
jgi:integrase